MVKKIRYSIIKTHCYPNAFQVVPNRGRADNATYRFHKTVEDAHKQIEKMGGEFTMFIDETKK